MFWEIMMRWKQETMNDGIAFMARTGNNTPYVVNNTYIIEEMIKIEIAKWIRNI